MTENLMIVNQQKPIKIINRCACIVDENELTNAILWYSGKPVVANKKIYMHGKYPAVSIYNEKIHVHRILMMFWLQRKMKKNEYSHHIDGNRKNASKDNLCLMDSIEHQRKHNAGKTLSLEHRQKISNTNRRRAGTKHKKRVTICLEELSRLIDNGWSISKMARHFNCDWTTIKSRIHDNPELVK